MSIRTGISGFGRIGRLVLRASVEHKDIDIVAINSTYPTDYMAYMMKYDTIHGRWDADIQYTENTFTINGKKVKAQLIKDGCGLDHAPDGYWKAIRESKNEPIIMGDMACVRP